MRTFTHHAKDAEAQPAWGSEGVYQQEGGPSKEAYPRHRDTHSSPDLCPSRSAACYRSLLSPPLLPTVSLPLRPGPDHWPARFAWIPWSQSRTARWCRSNTSVHRKLVETPDLLLTLGFSAEWTGLAAAVSRKTVLFMNSLQGSGHQLYFY